MFNEIDGNFNDVAIRTFKVGLPVEHDLRKSLTRKLVRSVRQLMDRIDEYKRVEKDQQQGKGKAKVVSTVFQELMHQILEKIKNEMYFQWPNKMGGDPLRRNQSLHCQYHQERGHTTEDCRTLWSHLEQLVKIGKLKQFLYQSSGQGGQVGSRPRRDAPIGPPLGTISIILAALGRTSSQLSRVMSMARSSAKGSSLELKSSRMEGRQTLSFSDEDKAETL
ncbi:uncharacterized protein LOC142611909 [Castanea sativa]|uniref:uncharacterized protein LOC142611909 n=1 Tax=Castanea sativa TaxID=21020 RepID=UPI003F651EFF